MCEITEHLNNICRNITRANTLNALHACRPDHPLNKGNNWCWRDASALVKQLDWTTRSSIDHADLDWLERMAKAEANDEFSPVNVALRRFSKFPRGAMIRGDKIADSAILDEMVSAGLITSQMTGKKSPVRVVQLVNP